MKKIRIRSKELECKPDCDKDSLALKWGGLKHFHFHTEKAIQIIKEIFEIGVSSSAIMQKNTDKQKELICQLIDECNGRIWNDWDGKKMTKKAAKKYVMEYGS